MNKVKFLSIVAEDRCKKNESIHFLTSALKNVQSLSILFPFELNATITLHAREYISRQA